MIEKTLVEKQAAFLVVSLRQKILQIPHTYARQLLGISDARVMSDKLREMWISILNDIKNVPQQVTDPHWLETLEEKQPLEHSSVADSLKQKGNLFFFPLCEPR